MLDPIKSCRIGVDGQTHNKLSTYCSVKTFFLAVSRDLVKNRNQRSQLSRLRVSAHRLECELGRYKRPQVPRDQRFCRNCPPQPGPHSLACGHRVSLPDLVSGGTTVGQAPISDGRTQVTLYVMHPYSRYTLPSIHGFQCWKPLSDLI